MKMDDALQVIWAVVTDTLIPSAAIVVSTVIAVHLARTERLAAEKARAEEREATLRLQDEAKRDAALAREEARRDRVLEELIEVFGFFLTAHPTSENWAPMLRLLQARIVVLQTFSSARALGEWLSCEQRRGLHAMQLATRNPWVDTPELPDFAKWNKPLTEWATEMLNGIAAWMRGDITDQQLREATARCLASPSTPEKA